MSPGSPTPPSSPLESSTYIGKLQGDSAGTAGWSTNVGNERGQVLQSVLTTTEGKDALEALASGLMKRYKAAGQAPPVLLYTDRDCCAKNGPSRADAVDRNRAIQLRGAARREHNGPQRWTSRHRSHRPKDRPPSTHTDPFRIPEESTTGHNALQAGIAVTGQEAEHPVPTQTPSVDGGNAEVSFLDYVSGGLYKPFSSPRRCASFHKYLDERRTIKWTNKVVTSIIGRAVLNCNIMYQSHTSEPTKLTRHTFNVEILDSLAEDFYPPRAVVRNRRTPVRIHADRITHICKCLQFNPSPCHVCTQVVIQYPNNYSYFNKKEGKMKTHWGNGYFHANASHLKMTMSSGSITPPPELDTSAECTGDDTSGLSSSIVSNGDGDVEDTWRLTQKTGVVESNCDAEHEVVTWAREDVRVKESRRGRPKQSQPATGRGHSAGQAGIAVTGQEADAPIQTPSVDGGNAEVSFLDYVSDGLYKPFTSPRVETVDKRFVLEINFPVNKLRGEKIRLFERETLVKHYKKYAKEYIVSDSKAIAEMMGVVGPTGNYFCLLCYCTKDHISQFRQAKELKKAIRLLPGKMTQVIKDVGSGEHLLSGTDPGFRDQIRIRGPPMYHRTYRLSAEPVANGQPNILKQINQQLYYIFRLQLPATQRTYLH
ncbi:hypothetical protein Bbelb_187090 [Branchiostoma belcheri]|nr:hypothetical protein Bbelb_187090 [Branchiostoma belcheri]